MIDSSARVEAGATIGNDQPALHLETNFRYNVIARPVARPHRQRHLVPRVVSGRRAVHKVTLTVWPHNGRAIALYRKFGFEVEGRLVRHHRRRNGELWDVLSMGVVLDTSSSGSGLDDQLGGPG